MKSHDDMARWLRERFPALEHDVDMKGEPMLANRWYVRERYAAEQTTCRYWRAQQAQDEAEFD